MRNILVSLEDAKGLNKILRTNGRIGNKYRKLGENERVDVYYV